MKIVNTPFSDREVDRKKAPLFPVRLVWFCASLALVLSANLLPKVGVWLGFFPPEMLDKINIYVKSLVL